jgi:hypothetical protein
VAFIPKPSTNKAIKPASFDKASKRAALFILSFIRRLTLSIAYQLPSKEKNNEA